MPPNSFPTSASSADVSFTNTSCRVFTQIRYMLDYSASDSYDTRTPGE